jgi:hypothetical protein
MPRSVATLRVPYSTALGFRALQRNTRGADNVAVGAFALVDNSSGYRNTAIGTNALGSNTTGVLNTAIGADALTVSTGDGNTATGYETLHSNAKGSLNTALGYRALRNSTGKRNLAVGYQAGFNLSGGDDNIYLGNLGVANESSTIRLGQTPSQTLNFQSRTFIAGIRGVNVGGTGVQVVINSDGQLGTLPSSARYKHDIEDMRESSQGLYQLRPVTFRYKQDTPGQRQYGLIAEEVVKVYPELVTKGADGKVESVQYHELIPMLLNEV